MGINSCIFCGNLVEDPLIQRSKTGYTYTKFTLAVNTQIYDKNSNSYVSTATFIPCIAYDEIARYIVDNTKKGMKIEITSVLEQSMYKDNKGTTKKEFIFRINDIDIYRENAEEQKQKWHSKNWF